MQWDEDHDVGMYEEDYYKVLRLLEKSCKFNTSDPDPQYSFGKQLDLSIVQTPDQKEKRLDIFVYRHWDAHPTNPEYTRAGYYLWNDHARGMWPNTYISSTDKALPTRTCHLWDVAVSCPRTLEPLISDYSKSSVSEAKMWSHNKKVP